MPNHPKGNRFTGLNRGTSDRSERNSNVTAKVCNWPRLAGYCWAEIWLKADVHSHLI